MLGGRGQGRCPAGIAPCGVWDQATSVEMVDNTCSRRKEGTRGVPLTIPPWNSQPSGITLAQAKPLSLQLPTGGLLGQEGGLGWTGLSLSGFSSTQNLLASATGQPVSSSGSLWSELRSLGEPSSSVPPLTCVRCQEHDILQGIGHRLALIRDSWNR